MQTANNNSRPTNTNYQLQMCNEETKMKSKEQMNAKKRIKANVRFVIVQAVINSAA